AFTGRSSVGPAFAYWHPPDSASAIAAAVSAYPPSPPPSIHKASSSACVYDGPATLPLRLVYRPRRDDLFRPLRRVVRDVRYQHERGVHEREDGRLLRLAETHAERDDERHGRVRELHRIGERDTV